jgi:hypothetical protein
MNSYFCSVMRLLGNGFEFALSSDTCPPWRIVARNKIAVVKKAVSRGAAPQARRSAASAAQARRSPAGMG